MIQQDKPQWAEITREERYFTSFLFHDIRKNPLPFLQLLRAKGLKCEDDVTVVDVGYEVCLFRDMAKEKLLEKEKNIIELAGLQNDVKSFRKLTFDLVLWLSNQTTVIIEAKAQQGFKNDQIDMLKHAKTAISCSKMYQTKGILLAGLKSGRYSVIDRNVIEAFDDVIIDWRQVAEVYLENALIYQRADDIYGK